MLFFLEIVKKENDALKKAVTNLKPNMQLKNSDEIASTTGETVVNENMMNNDFKNISAITSRLFGSRRKSANKTKKVPFSLSRILFETHGTDPEIVLHQSLFL